MAPRRQYLIIGIIALLFWSSFTPTVSAQESGDTTDYNSEALGIFEMLDRLTTFLIDALLRVGMIVLLAGALIWFTAKNSADRAQTGRWLVGGGIVMMVVSLGFNTITALIEWVATG